MSDPATSSSNVIESRSYFVRERNALAVRADFAPLYIDYYLHLMQHGLKLRVDHDGYLKDALAAFALHMVSRPWKERSAWTVHFQEPFLNVFVTGSSINENIVGRVFTRDIKDMATNLFFAQSQEDPKPARQSVVEFEKGDFFQITEHYYRESEQLPARFFRHTDEDFVMVSAQPDCDLDWFHALDDEAIRALDQNEELSLLEQRRFSFDCGCDVERIVKILAAMEDEDLFENDESIKADCPRCAAQFEVTRAAVDEARNAEV
ncbi:MAG: Hsp33 family molecular chaperone HslO [Verrucomicrobiota bacterium]